MYSRGQERGREGGPETVGTEVRQEGRTRRKVGIKNSMEVERWGWRTRNSRVMREAWRGEPVTAGQGQSQGGKTRSVEVERRQ